MASICTSIITLRIFCTITLHTSRLGKGTLQESQLTFRKILLCPLILQTLSIRDGSTLDRECLEGYFGSLLALGQILPFAVSSATQVLTKDIESSSSSSSDTFRNA